MSQESGHSIKRREGAIANDGEEKVSAVLAVLGLISGLLAAINQLMRFGTWRSEEEQQAVKQDLAENLESIEARLDAITEELERLEAEKDCQE